MLIMHVVNCLLKDKEMKEAVINMDPMCMVNTCNEEYPETLGSGPSFVHEFIKMAL